MWILVPMLWLAVVSLHFSALNAPFFADDYLFLDQARDHSILETLASPDPIGNFFRPVGRQAYFWILATVGGESPVVFHAANLALFLLSVTLLFLIARRFGGDLTGVVAAGIFALSYAADIPIRWASGSQDLLAVTGGLACLYLFLRGRVWWGAAFLLLGLLSKEVIVLTSAIALLLAWSLGAGWKAALKKTLPLFGVTALWAMLWFSLSSGASGARGLEVNPLGILAALSQMARVCFGVEWASGEFFGRMLVLPPLLALVPIAIAVLLARARAGGQSARQDGLATPRIWPSALGWMVLAALPIAAVASIWSAYYFLFSVAGFGLFVALAVSRGPKWLAVLAVVFFAWTSAAARNVEVFAPIPGYWTSSSHVNTKYLDRATGRISRYLEDLKRQRPEVAQSSTFFFFDIPSFVGWQTADGPLVRWAYRDSSLRSYYISGFTLDRALRGERIYFGARGDSLYERPEDLEELQSLGASAVLKDNLTGARDVFLFLLAEQPTNATLAYRLAWVEWALGDTAAAMQRMRSIGLNPAPGPTPQVRQAEALAAAGKRDEAIALLQDGVRQHLLDHKIHATLATALLDPESLSQMAVFEALAARYLDPASPLSWRTWGMAQAFAGSYPQAVQSLEHYLEIGAVVAAADPDVAAIMTTLRERLVVLESGEFDERQGRRPASEP